MFRPSPPALSNLYARVHQVNVLKRLALARSRAHLMRWVMGFDLGEKCLVGPGVRLDRAWRIRTGERCVLESGVWLSVLQDYARLEIGAYSFFGRDTHVEVTSAVSIGRGALIGPSVYITDHNHALEAGTPMFEQPTVSRPVAIAEDVWIGARAIILPGVTIGAGAIIAAGAVVVRSVPPLAVVGGVPSRILRMRS